MDQNILMVSLSFLFIFLVLFQYSQGVDSAGAFIGFFSQPRPLFVYALVLTVPFFFLKWFPGSIVIFAAGVIMSAAVIRGF